MGILDEVMADDGAAFTDPDFFGEAVTYAPYKGTAFVVNAVVNRLPPTDYPGVGKVGPHVQIFIPAAALTAAGVAIDKDGDRITVASRQGAAPAPHTIAEIISQDAAGYMLRLR